ncbi:hypothetical protein [Cryptosporangium sp. NPDC048952]|uniref:hypothetical protein n=1 Tax=Cryptosporangium sp. NPDC048952 TaxID=3363961 RepID=UPI003713F06E
MAEHDDPAAALFGRLRDDPSDAFEGPGETLTARAGRRRRRNRLAAVAALVLVVLIGAGWAVRAVERPDQVHPINNPTRPAPTAPSADNRPNPLAEVDWANTTLQIPESELCIANLATFRNGRSNQGWVQNQGQTNYEMFDGARPLYADLSDDGVKDAVVLVQCALDSGNPDDSVWQLLAYTADSLGSPTLLATVAELRGPRGPVYRLDDGLEVFDPKDGRRIAHWQSAT